MQQPIESNRMTFALWALLILLSLIWGSSFMFGRIAVQEIPPLPIVFYRVALAAICLWGFMLATGRNRSLSGGFVANIFILALLNNVIPFSLILNGQREIGSGLASIVNAMTPIWTVIIANWLTTDEKLSRRKLTGILAGFCGVAVLTGSDALSGLTASALAQASVLGATISYGFASVFGKRFKGVEPVRIATGQLTASTLIMGVILLATGSPIFYPDASYQTWVAIAAIAVLCTAIAYILFFHILSVAGATNVSLVTFLVPVSAILLGILFLSETLHPSHLAGMALIAIGLVILDGRLIRRKPTTP